MNYKKIRITGASGSGKTHLGKEISKQTKIKLTQLDQLSFDFSKTTKFENKRPQKEFEKDVEKALQQKQGIIEGGYYELTKKTYDEADIIIFLKTPFTTRILNIKKRFLKNLINKKPEGVKSFFKLLKYNIKTKNKWNKERLKIFQEIYKDKMKVFPSAKKALEWIEKKQKHNK